MVVVELLPLLLVELVSPELPPLLLEPLLLEPPPLPDETASWARAGEQTRKIATTMVESGKNLTRLKFII